jgi:hypothetical protein
MAEHDLHTIGTATFEEVSMLPRNILLRNETVTLGDIRYTSKLKSNLFLECTTAGTTSSTAVSFTGVTEGDTVTDGTVVWAVKKVGSGSGGFYGVCSTAAATAAKTVDCQGFKLETGASVKVKFTYTNTASSPTLNVASTGAKSIYSGGSAIAAGMLVADTVIEFVYDGTNYNMMGGGGTAYNIPTQSGLGNIWIE